MNKKVLVCGLGSMGKRRIRILQSLFPEVIICGVDPREDRRAEVQQLFSIQAHADYESTFDRFQPDAVFACSAPLTHQQMVLFALEHRADTFSELNLSADGYDRIQAAAKKNHRLAFLSSTFLYKKEIEWIINQVKDAGKTTYRYHTGQYLPDWHPWEDYRQFFASQKETSAIREMMAIELPWIVKAFGKIVDYKVMKQKMSKLDLDFMDTLHLFLEHENGSCGVVSLDCVSAKADRRLDVYSDTLFVEWNGTPDTLKSYDPAAKKVHPVSVYETVIKDDQYDAFIIENPYQEEVKAFFELMLQRNKTPRYGYDQDRKILAFIDQVDP